MLDLRLLTRAVAVLAAVITMAGGLAEAALSAVDRSATVEQWAERGARFPAVGADQPTTTPYGLPVADVSGAGWSGTHSSYPATDVFVGCGAEIVSPVWGTVLEVRRINAYDPAVDNPATRGGRSVAILGYDGVRYYLAHFDTIVADLATRRRGRDRSGDRHDGRHGSHLRLPSPLLDLAAVPRQGVVGPAGRDLALSVSRCVASRRAAQPCRRGRRLARGQPGRVRRGDGGPVRAGCVRRGCSTRTTIGVMTPFTLDRCKIGRPHRPHCCG